MRRGPEPPPVYAVVIGRHVVGRWLLPEARFELRAVDQAHAELLAVREAHRQAGVPPWRPFLRESMRHAAAEPVEPDAVEQVRPGEQLRLAA